MRALLLGLLLLAAPASAGATEAQPGIENPMASTPTTLWFHLTDWLQDFQISTQEPDPGFEMTRGPGGWAAHSLTCLPADQTPQSVTSQDWHTFFGVQGPGYVEYQVTEGESKPGQHPQRGLGYDVLVDAEAPMTLHWMLATSTNTPVPDLAAPPDGAIPIPDVAVHAWVRTGDDISVGNEAYRSGELVAEGETVGDLAGPLTRTTSPRGSITSSSYTTSDGRAVTLYDYALELDLRAAALDDVLGFNIQVSVFLKSDACSDPSRQALTPNLLQIHTSAERRPRLELSILNPVRINYLHPQIVGGDLVFHTSVSSPWGNYDIPEWTEPGSNGTRGGLTLEVVGPDGVVRDVRRDALVRENRHVHNNGIIDGADATYVWSYRERGAPDGRYMATFTARNQQHAALAVATATFTLGDPNELTLCGVSFEDAFPPREAIIATSCRVQFVDRDGNILDPASLRAPAWPVLGFILVLLIGVLLTRRGTANCLSLSISRSKP